MNPRTERIAFQIWALIQRTGGDCTTRDMAEVTGASQQQCQNIALARGWPFRRLTAPDTFISGATYIYAAAEAEAHAFIQRVTNR